MRVVVAPDSFKGSLTAEEAALHMEEGIHRACSAIEVIKVPMADGGEGTVRALVAATEGTLHQTLVTGPIGEAVVAEWGLLGDGSSTAVIEMAAASGLTLVPLHKRNPYYTTTFGTGQLILAALDAGCRRMIIGIGGSATNDGGVGMAQALGVQFYDCTGKAVEAGGLYLSKIADIDVSGMDPRVKNMEFVVACDVDNPLFGVNGAAVVYGPQKGATAEMVDVLDLGLQAYSRAIMRCLKMEVAAVPGSGAAGGLGAGLMAFLGAKLEKGINIVCEALQLKEKIARADLVLTGEGQIDYQTVRGKTAWGVAQVASILGVPVIAIAGGIDQSAASANAGVFSAAFSLCCRPMDLDVAMQQAGDLIVQASYNVMRAVIEGKRMGRGEHCVSTEPD
ncbi:MAG: glycerate kinase [Bacillota bacterium]|nr:MAG: glycerate kinase [Bacillota bacterium]